MFESAWSWQNSSRTNSWERGCKSHCPKGRFRESLLLRDPYRRVGFTKSVYKERHSWLVVLYSVITPAKILICKNLQASQTKDTHVTEHTSRAIAKRFHYYQRLVNGFWKRWHAEYLKSLTSLKKWSTVGREIHKDDLVFVSEDHSARGQWQRARVEAMHPSRSRLFYPVYYLATHIWKSYSSPSRCCDTELAAELDWTCWIHCLSLCWCTPCIGREYVPKC